MNEKQKLNEVFDYMKSKRVFNMTQNPLSIPKEMQQFIYDSILTSGLVELKDGYGNWRHSFYLTDESRIKLGNLKYSTYKRRKSTKVWLKEYRSDVIAAIALIIAIIAICRS